jgi:magnesium transporter
MITAFIHDSGGCRESQSPADIVLPQNGETIWVDLEAPTPDEAEVLTRVFSLHPLAIEDCWHEPQHPKIDDYGDYLFLVVHGVRYDSERGQFETHELNVFLGANYLVTFHSFHSRSVEAVKGNVRRNPHVMGRSMDFVLHQIVDRLIDNYFPKLEIIEDKIDEVEGAVLGNPKPEHVTRIFDLRRSVSHLKRIATQEREVLGQISRGDFPQVHEKAQVYFKDIYDHLFRIVEAADNHRETLSVLVQVYVSMVSNQLNHTMRILTVIATMMLPLTVITGIYGMNFDFMPELRWRFGYPLVLIAMAVVSATMLLAFRRRKWL